MSIHLSSLLAGAGIFVYIRVEFLATACLMKIGFGFPQGSDESYLRQKKLFGLFGSSWTTKVNGGAS